MDVEPSRSEGRPRRGRRRGRFVALGVGAALLVAGVATAMAFGEPPPEPQAEVSGATEEREATTTVPAEPVGVTVRSELAAVEMIGEPAVVGSPLPDGGTELRHQAEDARGIVQLFVTRPVDVGDDPWRAMADMAGGLFTGQRETVVGPLQSSVTGPAVDVWATADGPGFEGRIEGRVVQLDGGLVAMAVLVPPGTDADVASEVLDRQVASLVPARSR